MVEPSLRWPITRQQSDTSRQPEGCQATGSACRCVLDSEGRGSYLTRGRGSHFPHTALASSVHIGEVEASSLTAYPVPTVNGPPRRAVCVSPTLGCEPGAHEQKQRTRRRLHPRSTRGYQHPGRRGADPARHSRLVRALEGLCNALRAILSPESGNRVSRLVPDDLADPSGFLDTVSCLLYLDC